MTPHISYDRIVHTFVVGDPNIRLVGDMPVVSLPDFTPTVKL